MDNSEGPSTSPGERGKSISAATMDQQTNVYVWDMDETLILLKSLLNGEYAKAFTGSKDVQKGKEIGKMWEDQILQVSDEYFFYEQIENYNYPCIDALSAYDDGQDLSNYDFKNDSLSSPLDDSNKTKLAYRHRAIAHNYSKGLHNILDQRMMKSRDDLYDMTDAYTDSWLSSARAFLEQSSGGNKVSTPHLTSPGVIPDSSDTSIQTINVLVTSGYLIPSLVKCMLFRLDDLIVHRNVYSSWDVGKLQCFSWIKDRFSGPNVRFCVIGDGWEECEAAQSMQWPFVQVNFQPGSFHRFPGLTLRTVSHYIGVVYDARDGDTGETQETLSSVPIEKLL